MSTPSRSYRTVRWVAKEISETWFRDMEQLRQIIFLKKGVLFAAWHPGLLSPLVMISHCLDKLPLLQNILYSKSILGKVMKALEPDQSIVL